ncbi:MAG: exodeoxyribonuclease VII large subunit [Gammaproteobacteria bacterium]|nr:exodeoxyribonuclease VII large subunit [Gammaproteobacteria bacterium]MCW8987659.1 exodeoxyribonuclease VII large subunit [Gammaproteobacteria bacterium]
MNNTSTIISKSRDIYTVSRLNREVRTILETGFPLLWIEAELSNFSRPASGHWYFSLKDEAAQVKCAMFKNRNQLVKVLPANGKQVLVRAKIGLYEPRGDYQLIIEHMEEAGDGALRRQFEFLKNKLSNEGLFDASYKKDIPETVTRVGIITSSSGAAIHDILTTLQRRFPMEQTIVYPVPVQGKGACNKIAAAINKANARREVDILILARGGGSLEDLWEFNEEIVARAIFDSAIPIVTGIGHEVDFTIADFVADQRAATPTAAAELISPDRYQQLQKLSAIETRLTYVIQHKLQQKQQKIDWLNKRIRHPKEQLKIINNKLNELNQRNINNIKRLLMASRSKTNLLEAKVQQYNPSHKVIQLQQTFESMSTRFQRASKQVLLTRSKKLQHLIYTLDALSPLHTLKRGYAIIKDQNDKIIRNVNEIKKNQIIKSELAKGYILSTITEINDD